MSGQSGPQQRRCWTCRLRRKKCDGAQPACAACTSLGIMCHNGRVKPDWMDGGALERQMAQLISSQIREGASSRRQKQTRFVVVSPSKLRGATARDTAGTAARIPPQRRSLHASPDPDGEPNAPPAAPAPAPSSAAPTPSALSPFGRAWELDATMTYIDHVSPFLFPFYRPSLLATSRAWLLSFATLNLAVSHSVLSLSSFFITVGLKARYPDRGTCKSVMWKQVVGQAAKSFEMIRKDLAAVTGQGSAASLLDQVHMMDTIIQLLVFELFVGGASSMAWQAHLTPALALFEGILAAYGSGENTTEDGLSQILAQMAWPPPSFPILSPRRLWNTDQAAFRFFTSILLVLDILSAVALQRTPRLRAYHDRLLPETEPDELDGPLGLSSVVGCRNYVLRAMGSISVLSEWKKSQTEAGTFSKAEMIERAKDVSEWLTRGLRRLNNEVEDDEAHHLLRGFASSTSRNLLPTRIWARATSIYLSVTVNGWSPGESGVRKDAAQILELLDTVDSLAELRAFAWPLCVAGCVAEPGEARESFGAIVSRAGDSQLLGSLREVDKMAKAVWSEPRDSSWNIAACLGVLGSPALLF